jgi:hypothetical protein
MPPPHFPLAPGSSSLLDVPRPGAPIPFPLPSPPPSTAVFPTLGSSYLSDDLAPTAFSLFFRLFLGSLVWVFRRLTIRYPPPTASPSRAPLHKASIASSNCGVPARSRPSFPPFLPIFSAPVSLPSVHCWAFFAPPLRQASTILFFVRGQRTCDRFLSLYFFCLYLVLLLFFSLYFVCYLLVIML